MHILVVGGAGYIGSVTVDQLIDAGHDVTVLDSLVAGHRGALNPAAEFVQADVRDEEALNRLFAAHSFHAVINYGGYIIAPRVRRQPGRYFANNIGGAIVLLNAMVTFGVTRFVFSSSAAVYGEPQMNPIPEEHPMSPINPYGETKAAVERLLPWYEKQFGLQLGLPALLQRRRRHRTPRRRPPPGDAPHPERPPGRPRPAPGHRPLRHRLPDPRRHLRPRLHPRLRPRRRPPPRARQDRDRQRRLQPRQRRRLHQPRGHRRRAPRHRRTTSPSTKSRRRPGDPAELVASSDRIRAELGWEPSHPEIEDIIETAWRWHTDHPKGYAA